MSVDVLRVGMIGAGDIARTHAGHLQGIDGVRVAAVMDPVRARGRGARGRVQRSRVRGPAAAARRRRRGLRVQPAHVPPRTGRGGHGRGHARHLEKPIATSLEDGRAIAAALASSPARSMVGFNNRFRLAFRRWRDLVAELGPPRSAWILRMALSLPAANTNWRTTPGLLCGITIESASHDIDMVRWALGEIDAVAGTTSTSLPELEGFDDTLNAVLRLGNGSAVTLSISWSSTVSTSSRGFVGSSGAAELIGPDMWAVTELRWARSGEPETVDPIDPTEGADLGYRAASEHFIACVREDREPEVTARDGLDALEVSLALLASAEGGRTEDVR